MIILNELAWNACHKLKKIWTSKLSKKIKKRLFLANFVAVFLYGSETWTVTEQMRKKIDGCYTRMLRMAFDVHWQSHTTNSELYGDLLPLSTMIQQRRMRLSTYCTPSRGNDPPACFVESNSRTKK